MKFLSTLLLAGIAISPVTAQTKKVTLKDYIKQNPSHYQPIFSFMNQQAIRAAQMKTTVIKQRLIASSDYNATNGVYDITDSSYFYYNGNNYRGSTFDYNMMSYDFNYEPDDMPTFNAPSQFGFTSVAQPLTLTDSTISFQLDSNNNLVLLSRITGSYVNNNKIADYATYDLSTGTPMGNNRYLSTYDAQGRVATVVRMNWNNNNWDTADKRTIYYDAQGIQQTDTLTFYDSGAWLPVGAIAYSYTNNNLTQINMYEFTGSSWLLTQQYVNTYTASNQLQTSAYSVDTGGTLLVPMSADSFGYTNNSAFCTYWLSSINPLYFQLPSMPLVPAFLYEKHLNTQGLPDTTHIDIPFLGESGSQVFTYNSSNNPILEQDMVDTNTYITNYYYEDYDDLAVNNIPKATANINVYPNPSTDMLNIRWDNFKAGTPVSIRIINAAGQTVHSESFGWRQTIENLSMANLQAGVYWISIADNSGNTLLNQSIVKY
ncbi:T9SS type A sorting domain-containing protein [Taibaiella soli]|uniref:Secretion system C-terminal sorting domain-containing protein n=1 Tax=Taibaiella soli TaxID=1649169 RepID=A0A2W2AC55_9BACT|nr:T9SS type A sorting domain-containing protein [Taibaiella soli]PZF73005.1 hypothetical protein DN068_11385 [Taibaiella soli]